MNRRGFISRITALVVIAPITAVIPPMTAMGAGVQKGLITYQPPFGRRLFLCLFGLIGGFFLCTWGDRQRDVGRRLWGNIAYYCGLLLAASGLGLYFITYFRWSWGWWL